MKKRDIIKLVKETVAEIRKRYGQHDYYGNNVGGRNSISGMPGVWEEGLELEIDDEFVELVDDSGEYSGEIESDGSVSFSVVDDEVEGDYEHGFADWNWKDVLGPKHAFVKISEKIPTEVEALGDYVMITVNIDDLKSISGKQMDEEGESWGLEPRQLADSFTFEELEQLYNDNKITKEDLNGAKSYLQAWIDQHPTYLPQRDLNTSKRQAIRSYYLDPDRTTPKGGTQSSQFEEGTDEYVYNEQKIAMNKFGNDMKKHIKENNMKNSTKEMKMFKGTDTKGGEFFFPDKDDASALLKKQATNVKNVVPLGEENEEANPIIAEMKRMIKAYREGHIGAGDVINGLEEILYDGIPNDDTVDSPGASAYTVDMGPGNPSTMENMMESYMKERGSDNLMEHMDKHRKRAKLMEGATQTLFKLFNAGKTDAEVRALYFDQYKKEMPESFIAKLRNSWESLRKTKLDLTLADKEAEGFETIQPAIHGMEDGMEGGMEEKQLASGLFNENKK